MGNITSAVFNEDESALLVASYPDDPDDMCLKVLDSTTFDVLKELKMDFPPEELH